MATPGASSGWRVAIIGATSLKGKELKEVLEERLFPVKKLALLDDNEALGQLTEFEGEPAIVQEVGAETFTENDLVFFASTSGEFTRSLWPKAAAGSAALIDLSHALLDVPEAAVRVPFLEKSTSRPSSSQPWYVAPHAAAIVLLALGERLSAALPLRQMVANIFEPVSERGAAGLEELQEQTVRLLSFQEYPRTVFDAQVAFNLLARYGAASRTRLEETEDIIRRQIQRWSPSWSERVALRLIQAPVFHAHTFSVLLEFEKGCEVADLERVLPGERLALVGRDEPPAAAVEVAGREEILVGPIGRDSGRANAFWVWAAADNLRLISRTAVDIGEEVIL
ncbi:MAG: Asd/ArgC dimerization domain-containing protein [Candidatus Acidiferrales bacterium]